MRERFGASPIFVPEGKEHFHFDVPVCVSDQFYGWVCGFGGKIEVVSPAEVRDGLRSLNERLVKCINNETKGPESSDSGLLLYKFYLKLL